MEGALKPGCDGNHFGKAVEHIAQLGSFRCQARMKPNGHYGVTDVFLPPSSTLLKSLAGLLEQRSHNNRQHARLDPKGKSSETSDSSHHYRNKSGDKTSGGPLPNAGSRVAISGCRIIEKPQGKDADGNAVSMPQNDRGGNWLLVQLGSIATSKIGNVELEVFRALQQGMVTRHALVIQADGNRIAASDGGGGVGRKIKPAVSPLISPSK